jgi:hypothetical protein
MGISEREKFIILVDNDIIKKSDAIILLEGDGLNRCKQAVNLYKNEFSNKIVFSGGITDYYYGSLPAEFVLPELNRLGVKPDHIIIENKSQNTREQAEEVIKLALENTGQGLDFTLDQLHEVVPIISGTANYNVSKWMSWRTAFREALKLKMSLPDIENEYRLNNWLSDTGEAPNSDWSACGAADAVEYYNEVNGRFEDLKKSYEWDWLASYALIKRNLTPDQ